VTTASTIRTECTNDAHIASVTITTDTAINKQFHQQTSHEIDSADYVTFPRIFRETPRDDDHQDEMLRKLESKLRYEPSKEQAIFTTALPPLLLSRDNAERLKERKQNDNVRGAEGTELPAETGAIVEADKYNDMAVAPARNKINSMITMVYSGLSPLYWPQIRVD
jgi:hypothetical protein